LCVVELIAVKMSSIQDLIAETVIPAKAKTNLMRTIRSIDLFEISKSVLPANAGSQTAGVFRWIPAYAGMTVSKQV